MNCGKVKTVHGVSNALDHTVYVEISASHVGFSVLLSGFRSAGSRK